MNVALMEEPPVSPAADPAPCPEPPRDRGIWVVANIIDRPQGTDSEPLSTEPGAYDDEFDPFTMSGSSHSVETYQGYAQWDEKAQDWLNRQGMSIRQFYGSEFRILSWMECAGRASNCPDEETHTTADIPYYGADVLSAERAGFYADVQVYHRESWTKLSDRKEGPFATRAEAAAALARLLQEPIRPAPAPPSSTQP